MYLISGYWVPYFMYLFRNTEFKKYSPVVYGEFVEFVDREFDLDPMFPLQTIKLDETSIEGVRNILNKLISVHNIGGLLMSFDQRYWNKINQYNYIEHGIGLLDADGRLAQTSFTFVDDEGSRKKVEEDVLRLYPQLDETSIEGVRNILNKLISVHNIGGLLMSFDQRYWNKINQYNYIEHGIGLLDADGRLAQTSFTFVDDEGSRKKVEEDVLRLYPQLAGLDTLLQEYPNLDQMEEYADRKQQLGKYLTQLRNAVRASYATEYLTDVFYRAVSKGKLQRNKRHRRKEKTVQFAGRIGYQT
ncbi:hypothetical protein LWI29_002293 [Acer saccharum]|uniref:Uncharacterized protein n=1 Tax=Acer saccharum TaxID=4024 RepID=A0AA39STG0_ACESA|nr:hypothetical protein LWI29_002293 [Acer saccharum]